MIGRRLRYFAQARAAPPVELGTISAAASSSSASSTAARMIASPVDAGHDRRRAAVDDRVTPRPPAAISAIARHGLDRVGADARLGREHHRGGAVDHGVGDVGGLGAGRLGRLDHRLEHLGRGDHELAGLGRAADRVLLHQRHARDAGLDAVVAARDHQPVGDGDDLVERLVGLDLLDLGDQLGRASRSSRASVRSCSMSAAERTNESAMKSAPSSAASAEVGDVLLGDRRQLRPRVGDVDALARRERAGGDGARDDRRVRRCARPRSAARRRRSRSASAR